MARPLRIEYPGAFYHRINRGNGGENIFLNDRDKEKFLEYLGTATERFSIIIHTYCLMTNHYTSTCWGWKPFLGELVKALKGKTYKPDPVKRVMLRTDSAARSL